MRPQMDLRWAVAALLAGVLAFSSDSFSQTPTATFSTGQAPGGTVPSESTDPEGDAEQEQQPIFRTEIEEVTVPVTVTDSDGEFVSDLNPGDFRLRDNGVDQQIETFELSWEPVSMVIVAETSTRVQSQLEEIGRTGILFTQLIMGETGEAAVIAFDSEIKLLQEFTDDADLVEGALKSLKPTGDDVRLSDALNRAMFLLQRRSKDRRKVIVALSESRDNGSVNTPGFVLRGAQLAGISIYTVGLSSVRAMFARPNSQAGKSPFPPGVVWRPTPSNTVALPSTQANVGAANLDMLPIIEELVSYTKGLLGGNPLSFYSQGTGAEEFSGGGDDAEQALARIGRELRNQYLLTYRPNNLAKTEFHHINVSVSRPNLRVRTRPGYMYAGPTTRTSAPAGSPESDTAQPTDTQ